MITIYNRIQLLRALLILDIAAVSALPDKKILRFLSSDLQWQWVWKLKDFSATGIRLINPFK